MNATTVNYTHAANVHTLDAPRIVLPILFGQRTPTSLLDVGCGLGTWLKTALELGVDDALGIDGVDVGAKGLLVPPTHFRLQNLTQDWNIGRRFDLALCLEVAEHLPESAAGKLIDNLIVHADLIVFSAACPGQEGDHHINCQWPAYWQNLFRARGFCCSDAIRWQIWNDERVDVWYRQNLFVARRDPGGTDAEGRLPAVVHPDMLPYLWMPLEREAFSRHVKVVEDGRMPVGWYFKTLVRAVVAKLTRKAGSRER